MKALSLPSAPFSLLPRGESIGKTLHPIQVSLKRLLNAVMVLLWLCGKEDRCFNKNKRHEGKTVFLHSKVNKLFSNLSIASAREVGSLAACAGGSRGGRGEGGGRKNEDTCST